MSSSVADPDDFCPDPDPTFSNWLGPDAGSDPDPSPLHF
jgi:hypothetical protein